MQKSNRHLFDVQLSCLLPDPVGEGWRSNIRVSVLSLSTERAIVVAGAYAEQELSGRDVEIHQVIRRATSVIVDTYV